MLKLLLTMLRTAQVGAQALAAQSTTVAHGTSANGTSMQLAIDTNSTEVLNIDGVSLQASIVALVLQAVVAQAVAPDVVARAAEHCSTGCYSS
jgi:hypothetical protein